MTNREGGVTPESVQEARENMAFGSPEGDGTSATTIMHKCTTCDTLAKLCCAGCDGTPLPAQGAQEKTWYCSKECQVKDWKNHKGLCKEIKAKIDVQSLGRAAIILQELFNLYRYVGCDLSIASAKRKKNVLHVTEGTYDLANDLLPGYKVVEKSLTDLAFEDHAMLLAMQSCNDAFIHLYECCALFLEGKYNGVLQRSCADILPHSKLARTIKEIDMTPKPGPRGWVFERERAWATQTSEGFDHVTHLVTLKDGTQWALDLTAAKYGHKDNLVEWNTYASERVKKVTNVNRFGYCVDGWYKVHALKAGTEYIQVASNNQDGIGKAIMWSQYQISQVMTSSVSGSLKSLNLSAQGLLGTSSDHEFSVAMKRVIDTARKDMQNYKQLAATKVRERSQSGPSSAEHWTFEHNRPSMEP